MSVVVKRLSNNEFLKNRYIRVPFKSIYLYDLFVRMRDVLSLFYCFAGLYCSIVKAYDSSFV